MLRGFGCQEPSMKEQGQEFSVHELSRHKKVDGTVCAPIVDFRLRRKGQSDESDVQFRIQIYLAQDDASPCGKYLNFRTDMCIQYHAFCDDFGPMNITSIFAFVELFDKEISKCIRSGIQQLVYSSNKDPRAFTNAAFLLGAYLILKVGRAPEDVNHRFSSLSSFFEGYRDATDEEPDFRLHLLDCWRGLHRGIQLGWVALPNRSSPSEWGKIDRDKYLHYDNPLNADLIEVVPGKFIAFRGPKHLGGPLYRDNQNDHSRDFDPAYYIEIFRDLNVRTVVRLNEAHYSGRTFEAHGVKHHNLYFDDCTSPTPDIVERFLAIADDAKGLVAVHCKAGLGRTGTLIALYMMRSYGFTARAAIGWLRIMRPGSVIGEQQHFLCHIDRHHTASSPPPPAPPTQPTAIPASGTCVTGAGCLTEGDSGRGEGASSGQSTYRLAALVSPPCSPHAGPSAGGMVFSMEAAAREAAAAAAVVATAAATAKPSASTQLQQPLPSQAAIAAAIPAPAAQPMPRVAAAAAAAKRAAEQIAGGMGRRDLALRRSSLVDLRPSRSASAAAGLTSDF